MILPEDETVEDHRSTPNQKSKKKIQMKWNSVVGSGVPSVTIEGPINSGLEAEDQRISRRVVEAGKVLKASIYSNFGGDSSGGGRCERLH